MEITKERKELIEKLNGFGVRHIHGNNPYTMPIEKLKALVDSFKERASKEMSKFSGYRLL